MRRRSLRAKLAARLFVLALLWIGASTALGVSLYNTMSSQEFRQHYLNMTGQLVRDESVVELVSDCHELFFTPTCVVAVLIGLYTAAVHMD